ncbi:hypothetical protein C8Q75DRAFT_412915 [Abortiporus biennis]|nr:hypothetical protein C8Q75DRAFT_412915 [Abortiporus biennis]
MSTWTHMRRSRSSTPSPFTPAYTPQSEPPFGRLPQELLSMVYNYLSSLSNSDIASLNSFTLVCRTFNDAAIRSRFRHIVFRSDKHIPRFLEVIKTNPRISALVQEVFVAFGLFRSSVIFEMPLEKLRLDIFVLKTLPFMLGQLPNLYTITFDGLLFHRTSAEANILSATYHNFWMPRLQNTKKMIFSCCNLTVAAYNVLIMAMTPTNVKTLVLTDSDFQFQYTMDDDEFLPTPSLAKLEIHQSVLYSGTKEFGRYANLGKITTLSVEVHSNVTGTLFSTILIPRS